MEWTEFCYKTKSRTSHGGLRPFQQKSICLTQSSLRHSVVQIRTTRHPGILSRGCGGREGFRRRFATTNFASSTPLEFKGWSIEHTLRIQGVMIDHANSKMFTLPTAYSTPVNPEGQKWPPAILDHPTRRCKFIQQPPSLRAGFHDRMVSTKNVLG